MKAKMKPGQKVPESGDYECQQCNGKFSFAGSQLTCPKCGNTDLNTLVPIYMEDDPEEEQLYSRDDWHGGD